MGNVAWRAVVTIVLLVAVVLSAPTAGESEGVPDAARADESRQAWTAKDDDSTGDLPWHPQAGAPVPAAAFHALVPQREGGKPLTGQDGGAIVERTRAHLRVEGDYAPVPH